MNLSTDILYTFSLINSNGLKNSYFIDVYVSLFHSLCISLKETLNINNPKL